MANSLYDVPDAWCDSILRVKETTVEELIEALQKVTDKKKTISIVPFDDHGNGLGNASIIGVQECFKKRNKANPDGPDGYDCVDIQIRIGEE